MVELVQATPEELATFAKKCAARSQESETLVSKAIAEVEGVRAKWGGNFATAFGAEWGKWQTDMKQFPIEVEKTAAEMLKYEAIYRQADWDALAATRSVPAPPLDPGAGPGAVGGASAG